MGNISSFSVRHVIIFVVQLFKLLVRLKGKDTIIFQNISELTRFLFFNACFNKNGFLFFCLQAIYAMLNVLIDSDVANLYEGFADDSLAIIYAWLRGLRRADLGLVAALLVAAFVNRQTVNLGTLAAPRVLPFLVIGLFQAWQMVQSPSSRRAFVGACAFTCALAAAYKATWVTEGCGVIPVHMIIGAALMIGLLCRDRFARFLQNACAVILPVLLIGVIVFSQWMSLGLSLWLKPAYGLAMLTLVFLSWIATRNRAFLTAGIVSLGICVLGVLGIVFRALRQPQSPKGLVPLFWGALSLIVALLISFIKGGVLQKAVKHLSYGWQSEEG